MWEFYARRPEELEAMCYMAFGSTYFGSTRPSNKADEFVIPFYSKGEEKDAAFASMGRSRLALLYSATGRTKAKWSRILFVLPSMEKAWRNQSLEGKSLSMNARLSSSIGKFSDWTKQQAMRIPIRETKFAFMMAADFFDEAALDEEVEDNKGRGLERVKKAVQQDVEVSDSQLERVKEEFSRNVLNAMLNNWSWLLWWLNY